MLGTRGRDLVDRRVDAGARRLAELRASLRALSPGATLARGYAIAHLGDGTIVRDASQAPAATRLTVTVDRGSVTAVSEGEVPESGAGTAVP
ncbi:hypothetical protein L2X98_19780 [Microbacterium elymi]|uniref:Exonuclease VII large subunit C-terminal domain-containing protein n=1 Tax=Microbacterium elymi TaxID=2909587 RepID=A0ABY5NMT6_9MICO|nr:exodeoxyribonuclease VII large subunit [Microbacterium elymi]UUT36498.1 hypothetical protein L2X98_19780 [Microbacterium elymi]